MVQEESFIRLCIVPRGFSLNDATNLTNRKWVCSEDGYIPADSSIFAHTS